MGVSNSSQCQDPTKGEPETEDETDLKFEILGLLGAGLACVAVAVVLGVMVWFITRKPSYREYHEALEEFNSEDGQFLIDDEEDATEL